MPQDKEKKKQMSAVAQQQQQQRPTATRQHPPTFGEAVMKADRAIAGGFNRASDALYNLPQTLKVNRPTGGGPSGPGDIARGILNGIKAPDVPSWWKPERSAPTLGTPSSPVQSQPTTTPSNSLANPMAQAANPLASEPQSLTAHFKSHQLQNPTVDIDKRSPNERTTHVIGTPGQPGSASFEGPADFRQQMQSRMAQNAAGQRQQPSGPESRYSFDGPADARERFFAPVSQPAQRQATGVRQITQPTAGQSQQRRSRGEAPRPMTLQERRDAGIGWKTAREQLSGQWRDYTSEGGNISAEGISAGRNAASLAERQMAEAGANQRAGEALAAGAEGRGLENENRWLQNQQAMAEMSAREQLANAEPGSEDYKRAMERLRALRTSGEPGQPNILREGIYDEDGMKVGERFIQPNSDGTFTRLREAGGGNPEAEQAFMAELYADPRILEAYNSKTPKEREAFRRQWYMDKGLAL